MIELPDGIRISGWSPEYIDFGSHQEPTTGGKVERIDRLGNRFGVNVTLAPLLPDEGRIVVSRLIRAKSAGLRLRWHMNGFVAGNVGNPVINGSNQSGRFVNIRGLTANYQFREGQPLSLFQNNQNYIYFVDNNISANSAGNILLPISPMLRNRTVDGATVLLTDPYIDGYITGDNLAWENSLAQHTGIQFTIRESQ